MSNIYEALELAQREMSGSKLGPQISLPEEVAAREGISVKKIPLKVGRSGNNTDLAMDREMFCLYQNIEYLLPTPAKTILFIGLQGGEGVSTIVRDFARMATSKLDKSVLIMDAAHHNPSEHLFFDIKGGSGWKDIMGKVEPADKASHQAGNTKLFLVPISPQHVLTQHVNDHPAATGFLEGLKNKYDFILIDSSPAITSPDSIAISRFTDGVVLIVEAERTRKQVVENVKNKIVRNGGNILGVVLNKRKYYIPEFMYQRLFKSW
ncbi:MAG: CpsD/CapB family tyrosine-protein kinase [Oryzomonas sp.]|uniref:tyrosine-protein kinase family protein n=1 Tax=Oryzomonas sp. TaxID=2855186 RepID=UPI0028451DDA|nr:CpsD/CapB family tyrosine-protein kinase [Oryzomonas sp.]MDR3579661.1 CpsD/CapB family tyrosine-protein kinase [Oryzomonas sp.]